jgi:hypothetical protein
MGLDIRLPIGLMFSLLGAVLVVFGLVSDDAVYARSLGYNVNLWWGAVLLIFGVAFTYYGQKGTRALRAAPQRSAESADAPVPVPHGH